MEKVFLLGQMEKDMRVDIKMIKEKDLVHFIGVMEKYIKEILKMENKMEKGNILILEIMYGEEVIGLMEKRWIGYNI
jgi:hypothetical protein